MRDGAQFTCMLFDPRINDGIALDGAVESQQFRSHCRSTSAAPLSGFEIYDGWPIQACFWLEWAKNGALSLLGIVHDSIMSLSPVAQRFQHWAKTLALLCEVVLKSGRVLAVATADNEIVRFHALQACGQRIGGHPTQRLLKILKATRPMKEQITQ